MDNVRKPTIALTSKLYERNVCSLRANDASRCFYGEGAIDRTCAHHQTLQLLTKLRKPYESRTWSESVKVQTLVFATCSGIGTNRNVEIVPEPAVGT